MGMDIEHPERRDERREDTVGLDLEGLGNSVKVFRLQIPADGQLLFWGSVGIIRSGREGCWSR